MAADGTLLDALDEVAGRREPALVFHGDAGPERIGANRLLEDADRDAGTLAAAGVEPGDLVGLLGPNEHAWSRWAFAVWRAGGTLVPVQHQQRMADRSALARQVDVATRATGCRTVVAHPALLDVVREARALDWTAEPEAAPTPDGARPDPGVPAVAQFTSGTTGTPKAALVGHAAVLAAVRATAVAYDLTDGDSFAGWHPFFHDLGLFGLLLRPLLLGLDAHFIPTTRFARDPAEWFRLIGRAGATVTAGPSSAWAPAMRAASRDPTGCELASLRVAALSAEAIEAETVDGLIRDGTRLGLRRQALTAAYGMAETTLAITVGRPSTGIRFDDVDAEELATTGRARQPAEGSAVRRIASCGVPVPGTGLEVLGPDGTTLPERTVGAVRVRAPYAYSGYLGDPPRRPADWIPTGDLGYLADGELFFTGREKDVIVVLGRNHDPEDIEWAAGRVDGVRQGRAVAFATPGRGEGAATVIVEARPGTDPAELPLPVRRAVTDATGVAPAEVLVLPPGTVLKTTSGKIRRSALRETHAAGGLQPLARWPSSD
ncbi:MAG TPA: AMP-binding protein [Actinomycetota bacterium]|nr:AMP-binding protein [Actinomycetota bacterium]